MSGPVGGDRFLLVVGGGAEDPRAPLGAAVLKLQEVLGLGAVGGFDSAAAAGSCLSGEVSEVLSWWSEAVGPLRVLTEVPLEDPPGQAEVTVVAADDLLHQLEVQARDSASQVVRTPDAAHPLRVRERSPRVSVLIPVHDQARYLDETITSVLQQDYDDYEVVVLDDGSADGSLSVARKYESARVSVMTQPNIGRTGRLDLVFNRLLAASRGELLAWLGGDDAMLPHRLSAQVEAFDADPELGVCHGAAEIMDASSRPGGLSWHLPAAYTDLSAAREVVAHNFVGHPSATVRRSVHDRLGGFEQGLVCDYHFWLKSAGRVRFRYLPRGLVRYRVHAAGLSTSESGLTRTTREAERVRTEWVATSDLPSFFPELHGNRNPRVWREAALALGNRLLTTSPAAAEHLYLRARELDPVDGDVVNLAVSRALQGDLDAALDALRGIDDLDLAARAGAALRAGSVDAADLSSPGLLLERALADGTSAAGPGVRRWDGTPLTTATAYAAVVAEARHHLGVVGAALQRTRGHRELARWTVPTLGRPDHEVWEQTCADLAGWDLADAAEVAVEVVDDLGLLPPDGSRLQGMLRTGDDAAVLASWLARAAGAGSGPADPHRG
ncbi:glycosyltransferase [Streptomyces sp. NP160]|uniref:glycosyltransferase n=1 Tax=Streptomyces sp. NP160 TaxID=2586637 RepID=UPI0015D5703F|nr:glycosyltransferase [Streptomyces sp. NP160]